LEVGYCVSFGGHWRGIYGSPYATYDEQLDL
jgi:hypothetical protein